MDKHFQFYFLHLTYLIHDLFNEMESQQFLQSIRYVYYWMIVI